MVEVGGSNPPGPTIKKAPLWRGFFNGGLGWVRAPLRFDQMRVVEHLAPKPEGAKQQKLF